MWPPFGLVFGFFVFPATFLEKTDSAVFKMALSGIKHVEDPGHVQNHSGDHRHESVHYGKNRDHTLIHVSKHHRAPDWGSDITGAYRSRRYHLVRHLLRYYDARIRPAQWASQIINVTFGMALAQILDIDEKNQIITSNCWLNTAWLDFQLTWNPDEWGGIKSLRIPSNQIWHPDVVLYNSADLKAHFSSVSTNVIVRYTGNVTWLTMGVYKSICIINVEYFPFDIQKCSMMFSSWTYDALKVAITTIGEEGDLSNYMENTEWRVLQFQKKKEIVFFSCCTNSPYPFITYDIIIRRRPLFYIYNLFMPAVLITSVSLLAFIVPADSGEKVSIGITSLLSVAVFLMVVSENVPPTKRQIPLLGVYFGFTIVVVSCTTALTILTQIMHFNGKFKIRLNFDSYKAPAFLRHLLFRFFAKIVMFRVYLPYSSLIDRVDKNSKQCESIKQIDAGNNDKSSRKRRSNMAYNYESSRERLHSDTTDDIPLCRFNEPGELKISKNLKLSLKNYHFEKLASIREKHYIDQLVAMGIEMEWRQVSSIIDRVLQAIFLAVNIAVTLTLLVCHFVFGQ